MLYLHVLNMSYIHVIYLLYINVVYTLLYVIYSCYIHVIYTCSMHVIYNIIVLTGLPQPGTFLTGSDISSNRYLGLAGLIVLEYYCVFI